MAAFSDASIANLFKIHYGELVDITPRDQHLSRDIPFSQQARVGQSYVEAAILTAETGWTLTDGATAATLNAPRAGTVAQATVTPFVSAISSVVPWSSFSRSSAGDDVAFIDATKFIVKNNLKSHEHLQEVLRLYGQSVDRLGYESYFTGTYRGVTLTNGGGVLNGITFAAGGVANPTTNPTLGANNYAILFEPGTFAAGHWVGQEGCAVILINSGNTPVANGTLIKAYPDFGYIVVNFGGTVPTAATAQYVPLDPTPPTGTIRICYQGMESNSNTYIGVQAILSTQTGNLFGINTSNYSLWQGSTFNAQGRYLSFDMIQQGIAQMVNHSGQDGDIKVYLNPNAWGRLAIDQAALRNYDYSYKASRAENGFNELRFESQNGSASIVSHRCVKEGEAFGLYLPSWKRSGSAEVSMTIPGSNVPIIFPLESQMGFKFNSYADQFMFCHAPAQNIYWYNSNWESAT